MDDMKSGAGCKGLWLIVGALTVALPCGAQTTGANPDAETVIRSSVHEVLLDVVVRQKNMKLDRKLSAADFAVTEDGVAQKIKTFRLVTGEDTRPAEVTETARAQGATTATAPPTKVEEPGFVSIVFDEISPGSRAYARDAVRAFLKQELRSNLYVAIFEMDYRMSVIQNFSNNRELLAKAVDSAALGSYSSLSADNAKILNQADYAVVSGPAGVSLGSSVDFGTTPDLATAGAQTSIDQGAQAAAKIVSDQREIAMYQGGMRTVMALLNLVKYESALPGRKTVLYVSEGLNLPPDREEMIRQVVSSANRGNISFYGIDVRGLSTMNANALSRNLSASAASTSRSQQSRPIQVTPGQAKQDETIAQMSVGNSQLNMAVLAEGTGGFAVANTNNFGKAMLRVMEDVRTHYEISYVPTSEVYDGHFRRIQVTVDNPKLTVQTRDGYYALPDLNGQPVQTFELTALKSLDTKPLPKAFPFEMAALRFRPAGNGYRYEIAFDVATANITPKPDAATHLARLHATFVALIKDARGEVVEKVSREIDRNVPEDKLEQFRRGEIIFTAPAVLSPGRYTVEGVATDAEGNRASTKREVLVAPPFGDVAVSDVALVHDLEPLKAPRDPGNPLEFDGGKITPELDGKASAEAAASLYFVIYPGASGAKPKVTIQFFRDGAAVAETEPNLSAPDAANSIPVIASAKLPPGDYQARVTVEQGGKETRRQAAFTVPAE